MTGIEPALSAWEADVLPLNYTRSASLVVLRRPEKYGLSRANGRTQGVELAQDPVSISLRIQLLEQIHASGQQWSCLCHSGVGSGLCRVEAGERLGDRGSVSRSGGCGTDCVHSSVKSSHGGVGVADQGGDVRTFFR